MKGKADEKPSCRGDGSSILLRWHPNTYMARLSLRQLSTELINFQFNDYIYIAHAHKHTHARHTLMMNILYKHTLKISKTYYYNAIYKIQNKFIIA